MSVERMYARGYRREKKIRTGKRLSLMSNKRPCFVQRAMSQVHNDKLNSQRRDVTAGSDRRQENANAKLSTIELLFFTSQAFALVALYTPEQDVFSVPPQFTPGRLAAYSPTRTNIIHLSCEISQLHFRLQVFCTPYCKSLIDWDCVHVVVTEASLYAVQCVNCPVAGRGVTCTTHKAHCFLSGLFLYKSVSNPPHRHMLLCEVSSATSA